MNQTDFNNMMVDTLFQKAESVETIEETSKNHFMITLKDGTKYMVSTVVIISDTMIQIKNRKR